jgi:hypothetical protein
VRKASGPAGLLGQEILDLAVDRAQLVIRPAPNGLEQAWVESEQEAFALRHVRPQL